MGVGNKGKKRMQKYYCRDDRGALFLAGDKGGRGQFRQWSWSVGGMGGRKKCVFMESWGGVFLQFCPPSEGGARETLHEDHGFWNLGRSNWGGCREISRVA